MKIIPLLLSIGFLISCSNNVPGPKEETFDIPAYGKDDAFEIATWNIQYFPKLNKTLNLVKGIIKDIDVDMVAVQEIASVSDFNKLLSDMPGWDGELSSDTYSNGTYQKTGILYKSEFISVSSVRNIFNDDGDAFPRPPFAAYVEIKDNDTTRYDFNIIVLHLKASGFGDELENIRRRRDACQKLESYISQEIDGGADPDFIILGDWNDELTDVTDNVFLPFLDQDSLYAFVTQNLHEASYPSYNSLIDHILISADSFEEFNFGDVSALKIEEDMPDYAKDVSDHRPVVVRFNGITINVSN